MCNFLTDSLPFVCVYFPQVTQLTLTPDSPTLGGTLEPSPATPPTPDILPMSGASLRKRLNFSSSGQAEVVRDVSREDSSPEVFVIGSSGRYTTPLNGRNDMMQSMDDTINGDESLCSELYTTAVSSPDPLNGTSTTQGDDSELLPDLSNLTIRSDASPETVSSNPCTSDTSETPNPSDSHLDCSYAACITVPIPSSVRKLSNLELREKLVRMGEQPGPITDLTRPAYLAYLTKLEAGGARPAGNHGDKGETKMDIVFGESVPCTLIIINSMKIVKEQKLLVTQKASGVSPKARNRCNCEPSHTSCLD